MFLQNAQPSTPKTQARTHEFELEIGQESISAPAGFSRIAKLWLVGFGNRPKYLAHVKPAEFAEMGLTYKMDRADMPTHLCGVPLFYTIENMEVKFWPVPAHRWKGAMEAAA